MLELEAGDLLSYREEEDLYSQLLGVALECSGAPCAYALCLRAVEALDATLRVKLGFPMSGTLCASAVAPAPAEPVLCMCAPPPLIDCCVVAAALAPLYRCGLSGPIFVGCPPSPHCPQLKQGAPSMCSPAAHLTRLPRGSAPCRVLAAQPAP